MSRELKTEQELLGLVVKALDANPATAGWIPTGFHETVEDETAATGTSAICIATVRTPTWARLRAAPPPGIINELRGRYNLR